MTKEALEKEAEESSKKAFCIAHTHEDELIYKNGYLAGSEPREKRIEELEAKNEKMKCCLNTWYKYENERDTPQINIDDLLTETQQLIL